jgi:hypothetical protein
MQEGIIQQKQLSSSPNMCVPFPQAMATLPVGQAAPDTDILTANHVSVEIILRLLLLNAREYDNSERDFDTSRKQDAQSLSANAV